MFLYLQTKCGRVNSTGCFVQIWNITLLKEVDKGRVNRNIIDIVDPSTRLLCCRLVRLHVLCGRHLLVVGAAFTYGHEYCAHCSLISISYESTSTRIRLRQIGENTKYNLIESVQIDSVNSHSVPLGCQINCFYPD